MTIEGSTFTAFCGARRVASGPIEELVGAVKDWLDNGGDAVLVFDDQTGQQIDLDLRGSREEAIARLADHPYLRRQQERPTHRSGPGRPKLGVISREVSLLPRHWDWLNEQPGGASATLRKLVEAQMRAGQGRDLARRAHDAAARFAWNMGGNLPRYEELARAMTRRDAGRVETLLADWPADIRDHLFRLFQRALQLEAEAHHDG